MSMIKLSIYDARRYRGGRDYADIAEARADAAGLVKRNPWCRVTLRTGRRVIETYTGADHMGVAA